MTTAAAGQPGAPSRVRVLLASYDGVAWLDEQVDSVLAQEGPPLELVVSDDMSTDGTWEWWQRRAAQDSRIVLLPRTGSTLGAAGNFYRLLTEVDVADDELVALADQDDVWLPGKVAGQVALLASTGADGLSSNVTAVAPDGSRRPLRKDYPQRELDFLFEGPGPGCTFLLTPRLVREVQRLLRDDTGPARRVDFHDWLVYGVCRARGWTWHIGSTPTVDYRQHASNAFGANQGVRQAVSRLRLVRRSWHRAQAREMAAVALEVAPDERREALRELAGLLASGDVRSRARLARRAAQLRRRPRDQALLGLLVLTGTW